MNLNPEHWMKDSYVMHWNRKEKQNIARRKRFHDHGMWKGQKAV